MPIPPDPRTADDEDDLSSDIDNRGVSAQEPAEGGRR